MTSNPITHNPFQFIGYATQPQRSFRIFRIGREVIRYGKKVVTDVRRGEGRFTPATTACREGKRHNVLTRTEGRVSVVGCVPFHETRPNITKFHKDEKNEQ